jgi:hypothetical protein
MAYDRYDPRERSRDERSRWRDDRDEGRGHAGHEDRGFFERAGDEIASWFGDDDAERRRNEDARMGHPGPGRDWRGERHDRDWDRERPSQAHDSDRGYGRSAFRGGGGGSDYRPRRSEFSGRPGSERDYNPMLGGYTAAERLGDSDDSRRGGFGWRGRDESAGRSGALHDPDYHAWRQRQVDELDRDYDDYRRENQSRFESEFGGWREKRMQKRGLLSQIREHMEVVGNDEQHVGTVDRVAGDRLILTKSDPESGGAHHSLSCHDIDRIDGERIILDCSADEARERWRDESRSRALFEREDQGDMGDRVLGRSFSGTYR